jgi:hypothetical protein
MSGAVQQFRLDAEHSQLRLAVLGGFIAATVIGYAVLAAVLPSDGLNILAILGALFIGYVVSFALERFLKGRWHSGRTVELHPDGTIRLLKNNAVEQEIAPSEGVNVLMWRFEITKRARVPKGWSMVACAVETAGSYIALYTFVAPKDMPDFDPTGTYKLLKAKKKDNASGNELRSDLRLAGEERRLNEAETARWMTGAEMNREDFAAFTTWVQRHYAEYLPV